MRVLNYYHIGKTIPDGGVYIGRSMPHLGLSGSKFANPFRVQGEDTREVVLEKYRVWLWEQIQTGKITKKDLLALESKDLVCFCSPQKCHGDILINAVGWAKINSNLNTEDVVIEKY